MNFVGIVLLISIPLTLSFTLQLLNSFSHVIMLKQNCLNSSLQKSAGFSICNNTIACSSSVVCLYTAKLPFDQSSTRHSDYMVTGQ